MSTDLTERTDLGSVIRFYETHPINEQQILHDLARDGVALDGLTEAVLQNYDQDHFGGLEAVDALAAKAGIGPDTHVLDVCSGMGGPARYLACRHGCRVTGLDITESRYQGALRLTRLVGLDHRVDFRLGNALDMPFADASFDVVLGQEAFCHVPDKPRLIAECARVVRPGGVIAFTDILSREALTPESFERLQREMTFLSLESLDGYGAAACGQRLPCACPGRPQRLVDGHPEAAARDVSWPEGDHGREIRRRAFPQVGRHLRLLRRPVRGRSARRRPVRGPARGVGQGSADQPARVDQLVAERHSGLMWLTMIERRMPVIGCVPKKMGPPPGLAMRQQCRRSARLTGLSTQPRLNTRAGEPTAAIGKEQ